MAESYGAETVPDFYHWPEHRDPVPEHLKKRLSKKSAHLDLWCASAAELQPATVLVAPLAVTQKSVKQTDSKPCPTENLCGRHLCIPSSNNLTVLLKGTAARHRLCVHAEAHGTNSRQQHGPDPNRFYLLTDVIASRFWKQSDGFRHERSTTN